MAHAHPISDHCGVSKALGGTWQSTARESAKPGTDYGELVRERRRFGLPNPPAETGLPIYLLACTCAACREWLPVMSGVEERLQDENAMGSDPVPSCTIEDGRSCRVVSVFGG
jgi:hypothetical protein